jgi:hypothetical protein
LEVPEIFTALYCYLLVYNGPLVPLSNLACLLKVIYWTETSWAPAVEKTQKATEAKTVRQLSDAVIEKRYLDLQRLRDAVRMAEMSCAAPKKPEHRKTAAELVSAQRQNARSSFGGMR